jgi:hypothetical protein
MSRTADTQAPAAMLARGRRNPRASISESSRWGWGPSASVKMLIRAAIAFALLGVGDLSAQTRRAPARKPAPQPAPVQVQPEMKCPAPLGTGVTTKREYCDILSGRTPLEGLIITLPPHRGDVTLTFDLHNRHTYSEELMKTNRGYARYTAVIGALTMDNTLISRAAIVSEFRKATDLGDRISGGAGPGGVKAVAPIGLERVKLSIPEVENEISLLGEKVTVERPDGTATYSSPGRPIAVVSNVMIEYRPLPPGPPPKQPVRR